MMDELKVFENEEFGKVRVVEVNGEGWLVGKDVAEVLGYSDVNKAVAMHVDDEDKLNDKSSPSFGQRGSWIINESGLYSLVLKSKLPSAKKFKRWVTSEVLPQIRRTGGYVGNDDMFITTYLPFADENTKSMFKATLTTVRIQNEKIKQQQDLISKNNEIIEHKQEVINGLVDDVDIYTKISIVNRIIKRSGYSNGSYSSRYNEMYKCFKEMHHIDLAARCEGYNMKCSKKKDQLSIIKYAEKFNHMDSLYKVACKLYETEVNELLDELKVS